MTKARDLATSGPSTGLVLIKPGSVANGTDNGNGAISFSGVSTVSLNDVFSSTYDNYIAYLTITDTTNVSDTDIAIRLKTSTDDTSTNYRNKTISINTSGATSNYGSNASENRFYINQAPTANRQGFAVVQIYNPNKATRTGLTSQGTGYTLGIKGSTFLDTATQYTGITFFIGSGNMTGTISLYGIRK